MWRENEKGVKDGIHRFALGQSTNVYTGCDWNTYDLNNKWRK